MTRTAWLERRLVQRDNRIAELERCVVEWQEACAVAERERDEAINRLVDVMQQSGYGIACEFLKRMGREIPEDADDE